MHVQMNVCFESLLVRSWNINRESGFPLGPHFPARYFPRAPRLGDLESYKNDRKTR